jgi:hypothetical protein
VIDSRREALNVYKQFDRYHGVVGESLVWFKFDTVESTYHDVYDEGGREYQDGTLVPVLWVDQIEATETYGPEGERPTQRLRFAVSAQRLRECGVSTTEAHGLRSYDEILDAPWTDDRLHDVVYYDGRFYEVSNFQIRGRVFMEDVVIGVTGIETQPSDERIWDHFPAGVL